MEYHSLTPDTPSPDSKQDVKVNILRNVYRHALMAVETWIPECGSLAKSTSQVDLM